MTAAEIERIRTLRYVEKLPRAEVARRVGRTPKVVTRYAPTGYADRMTPAQRRKILFLRIECRMPVALVAVKVGCSENTVRQYAPGRLAYRPSNEPLREAFRSSGMSASEMARQLDWRSGRRPDASRVLRTLGIRPDGASWRQTVATETQCEMAAVLGLDPWEIGA